MQQSCVEFLPVTWRLFPLPLHLLDFVPTDLCICVLLSLHNHFPSQNAVSFCFHFSTFPTSQLLLLRSNIRQPQTHIATLGEARRTLADTMMLGSIFVTVAFATGALAGVLPPSSSIRSAGTASLKQVRNTNFVRSGPVQLAKIYNKYGAPLPVDLKGAVERIRSGTTKRSTGSAETDPEQNDVEYLTPVSIGTPAQVLNLDIDTGSSDLWVFSSETLKSDVQGQTIYDPNKSSTAQKLQGYTWQISYGDGSSSSGDVYTDTVTVGGLAVPSQAVEVAKKVSSEFTSDSNNDGLLGLGFSSINTVQPVAQNTFFDNANATLDSRIFTADLKAGARK